MKMEVIAVQQQYQTQFSGLGSNKYRDWTNSLTPPLSAIVNMNTNSTTNTTTATTPAMSIKSGANITTATTINNSNNTSASRTPYQLHHHNHHHSSSNNNNNNSNNNNNKNNNNGNSLHGHRHHQMTNTTNKMKNSINTKKTSRQISSTSSSSSPSSTTTGNNITTTTNSNNFYYCDNNDIDVAAVNELSLRLLDELRAAKSRHLTCTEVSLPCDLTPSIAAEIIRVSEKEPCGIRGCTIYIEFEDEPNNSRRIASLKLDPETVSTFEVYLTLRQDHRGWASLLPQFMKSLARTITISPEFTITKHKLYSPTQQRLSFTATTTAIATATTTATATAAISTPSS